MTLTQKTDFRPIPEAEPLLNLFTHRWDFIYTSHAKGMRKPQWKTESRHPLSDRLILQGAHLYGVRFGPDTGYAMIDIDADSPYHPRTDEFAIRRLIDSLEPLGITHHITLTSSASGGLHLYLPFPDELPTWKVAEALDLTIRAAGFEIKNGTLELFPNLRTGDRLLYAAHRLPLQDPKSFLLNSDFQPILTDSSVFVSQWMFAANQNTIDLDTLKLAIATHARRQTKLSTTAHKFLCDLEAEIGPGWTGPAQTNHLLGRIALLGYCFGHIIDDLDRPLNGERLVDWCIEKARSLAGFRQHCRHQTTLPRRIREWVRSVEASPKYFHYAIGKSSGKSDLITDGRSANPWNILQEQLAQTRIGAAIEMLPGTSLALMGIDDRVDYLRNRGISLETLYRHKNLWHPEFYRPPSNPEFRDSRISLLPEIDRNVFIHAGYRTIALQIYRDQDRNPLYSAGFASIVSINAGLDP
jgi:hypothetical protein